MFRLDDYTDFLQPGQAAVHQAEALYTVPGTVTNVERSPDVYRVRMHLP
jgi:hypothetical protein